MKNINKINKQELIEEIRLIPAVSRVSVEYTEKYGQKKGTEMFDYLCEEIAQWIIEKR